MPQPIQLEIPTPCHENWERMLPAEKGRHCLSCQKTVVDFTGMSDGDILRHLRKATANQSAAGKTGIRQSIVAKPATGHSPGQICGRFMPDQLNRQLIPPPLLSGKFRWRGWEWVLTGLLLTTEPANTPKPSRPSREISISQVPIDYRDMIAGSVSIKMDLPAKPDVDTLEEALGAVMGKPAINFSDTLPDSLSKPNCPPTADSADSPAITGGLVLRPRADSSLEPDTTLAETFPISAAAAIPSAEGTLGVYPNPIPRGTTCHITWPANPGTYQLNLFNTSGALLRQQKMEISSPQQITEFSLPPGLAAGIYILSATRQGHTQPYTLRLLIQ